MNVFFKRQLLCVMIVWICVGCRADGKGENGGGGGVDYFEGEPASVDPSCTGVRLTAYDASSGGWCEFDRTLSVLPEFVQDGMTFAIAEPWNGGSYEGESGEACGECWEVDTINGTQIVMVHDLCPIEGNPLCSGGYFHFDLSLESADALGGGGLDQGTARRVPCPVAGNVHAQINDANEWGYLRLAFINHRVPIRDAKVRALPDGELRDMERSGGAWHVVDGPVADDGEGIGFSLTSPTGEVIASTTTLAFNPASGTVHDLGVQFVEPEAEETADGGCGFVPPGDVFIDAFGGIEGVTWQPNPWGDVADIDETTDGCVNSSDACLHVVLGQWEGAHLYYRQPFPVDTFDSLALSFFCIGADSELVVAPSIDGERCTETDVTIAVDTWHDVEIGLSEVCAADQDLNGVTFSCNSSRCEFLLDDVIFR